MLIIFNNNNYANYKNKNSEKNASKKEKPYEELSPIGKWIRDHPNGLEGFVVNDRRILDGLSPFDPDYHLTPQ